MWKRITRPLRGWLARRRAAERDVGEELSFHVAMRTRELQARGLSPEDAEAEARRVIDDPRFRAGLVQLAHNRDRDLALTTWLEELRFDLQDAVRRLRRSPGFTLGVIGILALGLGANSAVFSVVNAVYFRPLPFADADRLVRVQEFTRGPDGSERWVSAGPPSLRAMKDSGMFVATSALQQTSVALLTTSAAEHISVGAITEGWSDAVRVRTVRGRLFTIDEEREGDAARVAVISHRLWQERFAGAEDVLGRELQFDGGSRVVVGVMPPGYRFPYEQDAWWPRTIRDEERGFFLFGRLVPGVSVEQANQRLAALGDEIAKAQPRALGNARPRARPMREVLVQEDGRVVLLLGWSVAVLLLIVASNIAMLLTTRVVGRERELALRAALGCGWGRLVRHLMIESIVIFISGALAGLLLTWLSTGVLAALIPARMSEQAAMGTLIIDWRVAAFTIGLAVLAGALVGGVAAFRAGGRGLTASLGSSGRIGASASSRRALGSLVFIEMALAGALLGGSFVLARGLAELEDRDVGFETTGLVTLQFALANERFATPDARRHLVSTLEERLRQVPGVTGVGTTTVNPLCCGDWGSMASAEGRITRLEDTRTVHYRLATPAFFDALGVRLLRGRLFEARDTGGTEPVLVVDDRFARYFWPGQDPIGRRVKPGPSDSRAPWMRVIGVVSAVEDAGGYTETLYFPFLQWPTEPSTDSLHVFVRGGDDVVASAPLLRAAVRSIDPGLAIVNLRTMDAIKRSALNQERIGTNVAVVFSFVGALLALSGVYGLVAFVVSRERREMAIRLALGATPGVVLRQVVSRFARLALLATVAGLAVAFGVQARLLDALGAGPAHAWNTLVIPGIALLAAAMTATWIPAQRILRLDPKKALDE